MSKMNAMGQMLANMIGASPDDVEKAINEMQQLPSKVSQVLAYFNARLDAQGAALLILADRQLTEAKLAEERHAFILTTEAERAEQRHAELLVAIRAQNPIQLGARDNRPPKRRPNGSDAPAG